MKFNKSDLSQKTNEELQKDLFESNFHHENYISVVIETLHERGITTSDIFKDIKTDDLVVTYCFDRKKHKLPYILLVKEELLNRDYDLSTIPDVDSQENYNSGINEGETKSSAQSHFGKWGVALFSIAIIVFIKFGVRYAREKSETKERENIEKSYIQEKENEEKLHAILYGADGLMQKKINVIKHELDSLKSVYEEFALTKEMKDEIVKGALVKMDSALVTWGFNDTEKLKDDKGAFLGEYKNELQKLLDSY